ncbi:ankyrin repeat protein nuc-2-like [Carex rostrata]
MARWVNTAADYNTAIKIANAARFGDLRMLQQIGESIFSSRREKTGKMVSELCDEEGDGALHYAAWLGHGEICEYLSKNLKMDVNLTAQSGKTPLCFAANFGDPNAIESLINCGANLNVKDANGLSHLHYAVIGDNPRAIEVLLTKGAQVDVQNFIGSALLLATLHGHISCVKVLLGHNANPNELLCGVVTPLLVAVMNNENCTFHPQDETMEIVELLIKAGADVNKIPVLSLAYHSKELMEYLLESGANPNLLDKVSSPIFFIVTTKNYVIFTFINERYCIAEISP